jgi:lysophospholipase L1-like esterase
VRPLVLISCLLLVAGCGAANVAADVEVVESRNTPGGYTNSAFERVQDGFGEFDQIGERPQSPSTESVVPVDVVAGPERPPRPRTVAVIGDSLTLSAEQEIVAAMVSAELFVITVDGVENRRMVRGTREIEPGVEAIEAVLEDHEPELWVIALGTNDVGSQVGVDAFREEMDELLALLPPDAPVIWVDLWIRDLDDQIVDANRVIRAGLGGRQGVAAVVDWHAQAANPGVIIRDGVHLTNDGQELFADSIVAAIDATFAN